MKIHLSLIISYLKLALIPVLVVSMPSFTQQFYKSPNILFDEDFTDGKFDDHGSGSNGSYWEFKGHAKFANVSGRGFPKAALRYIKDGSGKGWDAMLHWRMKENNKVQNILIHPEHDIVHLQFRAFSDVAGMRISPSFAVEIAMLEDKQSAPYGHDMSFEAAHVFIKSGSHEGPMQLDVNVENTRTPKIDGTSYAHHDGPETSSTLANTYTSEVVWRNRHGQGKSNIEVWGEKNWADFDVNEEMVSSHQPIIEGYTVFNQVQIALFDKDSKNEGKTYRSGYNGGNAQVGIAWVKLSITRRADFTLDAAINRDDMEVLKSNWEKTGNATIKEGDATNDKNVDINDANALIAFWTEDTAGGTAKAVYNPATGDITVDLQNVSFFQIKGPTNSISSANISFSGIENDLSISESNTFAVVTSNTWQQIITFSGAAQTGLNADDFELVYNHRGSLMPEGISVTLSEGDGVNIRADKFRSNYQLTTSYQSVNKSLYEPVFTLTGRCVKSDLLKGNNITIPSGIVIRFNRIYDQYKVMMQK